jgi:hypothetical protein
MTRRFWLAAMTVSLPLMTAAKVTSFPSAGRAYRRPERVEISRKVSRPKRSE